MISNVGGVGGFGVYVDDGSTNLTLSNLLISGFQYGVLAASDATVSMTNSTVENATYDVMVSGSSATPVSLSSTDLLTTGQYAYYNSAPSNQSATACYWGTISSTAIQALIYDSHQNSSLGTVDFTGFLSSPVNATGAGW